MHSASARQSLLALPRLKLEVGMGATQLMYADRHAFTVVRVSPSGKTVWVQQDNATRTDKNGMSESQEYTFTPNKTNPEVRVNKTKHGWHSSLHGSFALGYRYEYYDYSF